MIGTARGREERGGGGEELDESSRLDVC